MATNTPNWNYTKKDLPGSQAIPNGNVYVDVRLKTIDGDNPKGYLPLYPNATTREEGKNLQYAIQTDGKVTWRVVDDDGFVRRQFNNLQELASSGYNFGFPITTDNVNAIKNQLNDTLSKRTNDIIISGLASSPLDDSDDSDSDDGGDPQPTGPGISRAATPIKSKLGILTYPEGKKEYRYPLEVIDKDDNGNGTDYLLIGIKSYKAIGVGNNLIRSPNQLNTNIQEAGATIILPMPSNIQDGNSVSYADGSLDGITAAVAEKALDAMTTASPKNLNEAQTFTKNLATNLGELGSVFTNTPFLNLYLKGLAAQAANLPGIGNVTREQILSRESGGILNPNMELFFNGVALRSFRFSFKMTPRNKKEADEIKYMIKTLKANMAPKTTDNNQFLRTPNVFDLQYMQGSRPHPFLHTFKTCALTDMSVNYTGEGLYASYRDPLTNEAAPISMVMDLTFKELEPIYDTDYDSVNQGVGY